MKKTYAICTWSDGYPTPPDCTFMGTFINATNLVVGEGIYQTIATVTSSSTYVLIYDYKLSTVSPQGFQGNENIMIALLKHAPMNGGTIGFGPIYNFPDKMEISSRLLSTTTWQTSINCFQPDDSYNNLWIRPISVQYKYFANVDNLWLENISYVLTDKTVDCEPETIGPDCPSDNPYLAYHWMPEGQTTPVISVSPTTSTTYTLTTSCFSDLGHTNLLCSTNSTVDVAVTRPEIATSPTINNVSCFGNDGSVCVNAIGGTFTYLWSNSATSSCINSLSTGTYNVLISNNNGCTKSESFIVGLGSLFANAGNNKTACSGANLILGGVPTATGGTPPYIYSWSPTTGLNNSTISNPIVNSPASSITFTVAVTDQNGCTATSSSIITFDNTHTSPSANAGPDVSVSEYTTCNSSLVHIGTTAISNYTYVWNCSDQIGYATIQDPFSARSIVSYNMSGFSNHGYDFALTVTNPSNGCKSEDIVHASFAACRIRSNLVYSSEDVNEFINVFPNPSLDIINVTGSLMDKEKSSFEIYDFTGKCVFKNYYNGNLINDKISLKHLSPGLYVYIFRKSNSIVIAKNYLLIK